MGREAECICQWGGTPQTVKAYLESGELILRGALRRRVPFHQMEQVRSNDDRLSFLFQGEPVSLLLGPAIASRWLQTVTSPPATLATKLGIQAESTVWMLGEVDDSALEAALANAKALSSRAPTLIVARIHDAGDLANALRRTSTQLEKGIPLWLVYRKGKGHPLTESGVRSAAREIGLIDTKVAAVSATLTALRFVKRS